MIIKTAAGAAIVLVASLTAATAGGLSEAEIKSTFIGKAFAWKHASGVGGNTVHNADGTMTYDVNGKQRKAKWAVKDGSFCVNAGEKDEACFALVAKGGQFMSENGNFVYTPK